MEWIWPSTTNRSAVSEKGSCLFNLESFSSSSSRSNVEKVSVAVVLRWVDRCRLRPGLSPERGTTGSENTEFPLDIVGKGVAFGPSGVENRKKHGAAQAPGFVTEHSGQQRDVFSEARQ
jgi:hypothetical protein